MNIFGFKTWSRLHEDDSMPNNNEKRKEMTIDSPAHFIMNPEGVVIRTNLPHATLSDDQLETLLREKHGLEVTHHINDMKRVGGYEAQYKKNALRTSSMRYNSKTQLTDEQKEKIEKNKSFEVNRIKIFDPLPLGPKQRISAKKHNERSITYFKQRFGANSRISCNTQPNLDDGGKIQPDCLLKIGTPSSEFDSTQDIHVELKPYARRTANKGSPNYTGYRSLVEHSRTHRYDAKINGSGGLSSDLEVRKYIDMFESNPDGKNTKSKSDRNPSWKIFNHIRKNFPSQYFKNYNDITDETEFKKIFSNENPQHLIAYTDEIQKWWNPNYQTTEEAAEINATKRLKIEFPKK